MDDVSILVTSEPSADALSRIGDSLHAFNDHDVGPSDHQNLAVLVSVEDELVAGLSGYTAWHWLYVQRLWVADSRRGQNLAARMLDAAEREARIRGCHGAYIDTFSEHALHVYQKAGYAVFGALDDFPPGRTRSFLSKRLV